MSCSLTEEINDLKARIKELECKYEWPKIGMDYYYIENYGTIGSSRWNDGFVGNVRRNFLGIYRTKDEAQEVVEIARLLKDRGFIPGSGEKYWSSGEPATRFNWTGNFWDKAHLALGLAWPDTPEGKAEAEAATELLKKRADRLMKK